MERAKSFLGCSLLAKNSGNLGRDFWPVAQEVHWFLQASLWIPPQRCLIPLEEANLCSYCATNLGCVYWSLAGLREPLRKRGRDEDTDLLPTFFGVEGILKRIVYIYRKPPDSRD